MMKSRGIAWAVMALALLVGISPAAVAGPVIGSQGFFDSGSPSTDTGNINTATTFTIAFMESSSSSTGIFAGLPTQFIGTVGPFSLASGANSTLTFGSALFGTFTSTTETVLANTVGASGTLSLYFLGNWTPGSYEASVPPGSYASSFTFSATQTPVANGAISDSGTFAIPPAPLPGVPEPAAVIVFGLGGVGLAGFRTLRRRCA